MSRDLASKFDPEDENSLALATIRAHTGVPVAGVTAYGMGADCSYSLRLADGTEVALTATQILTPSAWRRVALTVPGGVMEEAPSRKEWLRVEKAIRQVLVVVTDSDSLERSETLEWIRATADACNLHEVEQGKMGEVLHHNRGFRREGHIYLRAESVAAVAREAKARPTRAEMVRRLKAAGFKSHPETATYNGRKLCRSYWSAPVEVLDGDTE